MANADKNFFIMSTPKKLGMLKFTGAGEAYTSMASLAKHGSYQTFHNNLPFVASKGFPEGVIIFLELERSSNFLHGIFQYPT
ncbi:MAG: hypothetical protein ACO3PX_14295, partial [bacterium]